MTSACSSPSLSDRILQLSKLTLPGKQPNAFALLHSASSQLFAPFQNVLATACRGCPHLDAQMPKCSPSSEAQMPRYSSSLEAVSLSEERRGALCLKEKEESFSFASFKAMEGTLHIGVDHPSMNQLWSHPLALLSYVPQDAALFVAGAVAGAAGKILTAPLDRIKISMQVHSLKGTQETARKGISFLEATMKIGKEEGFQGYWRGYFPQVMRIVPYSAVQLVAYEAYKKIFKGEDKELSVPGRLAAGACAGMTSTLITYPLDVLRLRLVVDPASKSMLQVASTMLREEGLASFYRGLGPSLLGIAPYVALNFCAFDLIKKSLSEEVRKTPAASFVTAFLSASLATSMCYPLDTARRQLQMRDTPFLTLGDALPGIVARDGVMGLYRGFVPNTLKLLPTSSIRLTIFDVAKRLLSASRQEFQRLSRNRREEIAKSQS